MQTIELTVLVYQTRFGTSPFENWFNSLEDIHTKKIILARLGRMRVGNFGNCRSVGGGIRELRIHFGPGYRIYFGQAGPQIVILLVAGNKSTQKRDILRATEFWNDYKKKKQTKNL